MHEAHSFWKITLYQWAEWLHQHCFDDRSNLFSNEDGENAPLMPKALYVGTTRLTHDRNNNLFFGEGQTSSISDCEIGSEWDPNSNLEFFTANVCDIFELQPSEKVRRRPTLDPKKIIKFEMIQKEKKDQQDLYRNQAGKNPQSKVSWNWWNEKRCQIPD